MRNNYKAGAITAIVTLSLIYIVIMVLIGTSINLEDCGCDKKEKTVDAVKTTESLPKTPVSSRDLSFVKYDSLQDSGIDVPLSLFLDIEYVNEEFNIPDSILYRLINRESLFKATAVSRVGAIGLMQVMPATFKDIVKRTGYDLDMYSHLDNLYAGMWYLDYLHKRVIRGGKYKSDTHIWKVTLAAYNAGYTRASHALVHYKETREYVKYILNT